MQLGAKSSGSAAAGAAFRANLARKLAALAAAAKSDRERAARAISRETFKGACPRTTPFPPRSSPGEGMVWYRMGRCKMWMAVKPRASLVDPVVMAPISPPPVTTAPPVPSPVPKAASLPEVSRRFPQPVQTSTRTRTVYAVKKMDRPSPAPGAVVVEPEKKTNWLPLILAAGGAAFFLKG